MRDRMNIEEGPETANINVSVESRLIDLERSRNCFLYTSDAADELLCVDLGGDGPTKKQSRGSTARDAKDHKEVNERCNARFGVIRGRSNRGATE